MSSVGERATRGAAWNVVGSVATRVVTLAGTLLLTRFIAPAEYGEVSAATVCVTTATTFSNLKFGQYIIAKKTGPELGFQAAAVHVVFGLLAVGLVVLLREPLGLVVDAPGMVRFVPGLALAGFVERFAHVPERTLVRDLRFREISISRSLGDVMFVASALSTAPFIHGMSMVLANNVRAFLVTTLLVRATYTEWAKPVPLRWSQIKPMLKYSLPMTLAGLAEHASTRWDNLMMSRFFGPRELGMYNLAYNLAETPGSAVGETIGDVLFPSFAKLDPERREPALRRASQVMALLVFPMAAGLAAVAATLVPVFFDKRWSEVAPMVTILSVLSITRPVSYPLLAYLQAHHRQPAVAVLSVIKVVVLLGSLYVLGRHGPHWACFAVGVAFFLDTVLNLACNHLLEKVSVTKFVLGILPVVIACGVMSAGVIAVRLGMQAIGHDPSWLSLFAQILAGVVGYLGASYVLCRAIWQDLITQIKRVIQRKRGQAT